MKTVKVYPCSYGKCIQYDYYAQIKCPHQILGGKNTKEEFTEVNLERILSLPTYTYVLMKIEETNIHDQDSPTVLLDLEIHPWDLSQMARGEWNSQGKKISHYPQ